MAIRGPPTASDGKVEEMSGSYPYHGEEADTVEAFEVAVSGRRRIPDEATIGVDGEDEENAEDGILGVLGSCLVVMFHDVVKN